MMIAAALGAAFPDVAGSCAVSAPALPHTSLNFVAQYGSPRLTWADEVFTAIHASNSFLDWDSQLHFAARPSIFSKAIDLFTADAVRMFN